MATKQDEDANKILSYKGRNLVRKGNLIYYGNFTDKYITALEIMGTKKVSGIDVPEKVAVALFKSRDILEDKHSVPIKLSVRSGLSSAIDISTVWLDKAAAGKI